MGQKIVYSRGRRIAQAGITLAAAGLFFLIRPDIFSAAVRVVENYPSQVRADIRKTASPRIIEKYLHENTVRKLQIGAGPVNFPGWLNTDIEPSDNQAYLDASRPFPLPDASFQLVFSEHVIEHLTLDDGLTMLKESYRVLAPGGKVRLATPNLLKLVALFSDQPGADVAAYVPRKLAWDDWPKTADPAALILNYELRGYGHQFVYTPKLLRHSLEQAGFSDIRQYAPGESDDPEARGLESRATGDHKVENAYESMVFEATRK